MHTATLTAPPRFARQTASQRRPAAPMPRVRAQSASAEDPYQGFSKEDYESLCKDVALYKAGKLKLVEREIPEFPDN